MTDVPTWPPSVWLAGDTETAYGGASGMMCGLPVAPTFWSDVTVRPSSTIVVICLRSLVSIVTREVDRRRCCRPAPSARSTDLPVAVVAGQGAAVGGARERRVVGDRIGDRDARCSGVADVLDGDGVVDLAAGAQPARRASALLTTRAGTDATSCIVQAPRPCVPAARLRFVGSRLSCQISTLGKPVPSCCQLLPPLYVTNGPTSVPA